MIVTEDFPNISNKVDKLLVITNEYELFDLVKAVFCINICINNRSTLESCLALNQCIVDYNQSGDKTIATHSEFCEFFKKIEEILKPDIMDDYTIEDFGEVKILFEGRVFKVIIGTGHNQVFGCLSYLPYLAEMTGHHDELKELLIYFDGIVEFFQPMNVGSYSGEIKFQLPSIELFERTNAFFYTKVREYDIWCLNDTLYRETLPIEKRSFVDCIDNIYPLFNSAMLVDVYDKWYQELSSTQRNELADYGIKSVINDIQRFNGGNTFDILSPVKLFKDGKPIEGTGTYSFIARCEKGVIIAINSDEYSDAELAGELSVIDKLHSEDNLKLIELTSINNDNKHRGVTITRQEPIKYILYNSHTNIEQRSCLLGDREEKHLKCSALDMIYILLFMDDFDELYDYLEYNWNNDFDQMFGFGGDSSKFLTWKEQGHMFAKGAIRFGMVDLGYSTENDFVVNYYKNELIAYPWKSNEFMFSNPFMWKITILDEEFYQYASKYAIGIGGMLKCLKNKCTLFFTHNINYYLQTDTIVKYREIIPFIDDLNFRLISDCESVFAESALFANKYIQVMFLPKEYAVLNIDKAFLEQGSKYVYSDMKRSGNNILIQYAINEDSLFSNVSKVTDRCVEAEYFMELFKPIKAFAIEEYQQLTTVLEKLKPNKKTVDACSLKLEYYWNKEGRKYHIEDKAYYMVKKNIAFICKEHNIKPGEYYGKDANQTIRAIQKALIEDFEQNVSQFSQLDLHLRLLEIYSEILHNIYIHKIRYNAFSNADPKTIKQMQLKVIEERETYKHNARSLSYLIETNLFLDRSNEKIISDEEFQYLLAYANWLVILSDNADICHFTEEEAHIEVTFEYVVDVLENEGRGEELGDIPKRMYNDKGYTISDDEQDHEYIEKLQLAFYQDTDIELSKLLAFMDYLQMYFLPEKANEIRPNVYSIEESHLIEEFSEISMMISKQEIERIIEFLSIQPLQLKTCRGKEDFYLPIGERKYRDNRFDIKPLWKSENSIIFSPPVIYDIHLKWESGTLDFYLPYEIGLDNTKSIIVAWKAVYEKKIVFDIEKIFIQNGYSFVKHNLELCKIDKKNKHPQKLGDYDVFVIDSKRKEIWLIECKVIEKVGSFYEMYRQQNRFFKEHREDEMFQIRIDYMKEHYKQILKFYNFDDDEEYKIIPYMVMNKVLVSRYKKLQFPIISFGELDSIIENCKGE